MKAFGNISLIFLGVLLLALGALPGTLRGQTAAPPAPAAPPVPAAPAAPAQNAWGLDFSAEQIQEEARTIQQELGSELADLEKQITKEVEMGAPGLSRLKDLSAQLESKSKEYQARAKELSAHAEEYAAQVGQEAQEEAGQIVREMHGMFDASSEEGSGWLGVEIGEVTQENAKDLKLSSVRGVLVTEVEPDSPAAKAGMKENDVITQFEGETVAGTAAFRRMVRETPPGHTVALVVTRDGATQNISVELGDRSDYYEKKMKGKMRDFGGVNPPMNPPMAPGMNLPPLPDVADMHTPVLGISAEDLTGQLGAFFGAPDNAGVLVREVRPGTAADKAGLKAGDVIVKVNDEAVRTLADLREILRDKSDQKTVNLGILRKGSEMSVTVGIELPRSSQKVYRRAES